MRLAVTSRRLIAALLCVTFILSISTLRTHADDGPRIVIKIGQPAVWSLGQAHYLLEKMHRRNRNLASKFPTEDDLDPNRISATRIDALRSSLAIEGQFDQAAGVKNSLALRRLREADARRETARADSSKKQAELDQTNNDLEEINEKIALLEEENKQSQEARERETPPAAPTAEENQRRKDLALLKVRKTRKEEQRDALKSDITALNTTANTEPAAPTLEEPALSGNNAALPTSKTFDDFMDKALKEAGKPDLSASMKLNNFIQGQYEIIANQLTLLKDEVGPDDRLVFLELPASIYTVDKKADDYVAQVEWRVSKICDTEPSVKVQEGVIREELKKQGKNDVEATEEMLRIENLRDPIVEGRAATYAAAARTSLKIEEDREWAHVERYGKPKPYPITLEMIKKGGVCTAVDDTNRYRVRAIDIIPRQSALNVNEYHATVKQTAILAAFKFLIGFAGSVSYQRQRELYEQFVQQQIFASGYGKGQDLFGWTYGPQPGTRRISPGEKTTFAVMIVPRNTLALELKANSRFYKRQISPADPDQHDVMPGSSEQTFFLSVPGKRTQEFWVDGISYSPVKKGKRVTAVIDGNFFSPQMGILVNGVPLEPVVSISRIAGGTEETDVQSADGVAGEYEITSSRQIILSFTMGENYVGTPTISVTSPEKTTAINFFDLKINHGVRYSALSDHSRKEPMFFEDFSENLEIEPIGQIEAVTAAGAAADSNGNALAGNAKQATYKLIRLKGSGLRPDAEIVLNNKPIPIDDSFKNLKEVLDHVNAHPTPRDSFAVQESTKSYLVYAPTDDKWKIGYLQLTRQGYENASAVKDFSSPTFGVEVQNYRFLPGASRAEVDLNVLSAEGTLDRVDLEDPALGPCSPPKLIDPDNDIYRVKCLVPADNNGKIERTTILIKAVVHTAPVKAVFADVALPVKPQLFSVFNPRTGRPEGFATEGATIIISGANLQAVTSVFFGDQKGEISGRSSDSITVKAPNVTGVAKGQAVAVPIILETAAGKTPTGAIYTYQGEPQAPNVIVWPYRPKEK